MLLQARSLSKRYGANLVLHDVSFSLREREVLGLIGPNGAGKTTLFECLAGLIHADSGEVWMGGRAVPPSHRKNHLFYVPDGIRPWRDQTAGWVLSFVAALYRAPAGAVVELTDALQLGSLLKSRVGELSKGESKRLLAALGLLTPHPLLLLDEPFDGLDFRQTRDAMSLLRQVPQRSRRTLFLSIHQLNDASRVCDRLVLLGKGTVVGEGTLGELRTQANLREGGLEEVFLALT